MNALNKPRAERQSRMLYRCVLVLLVLAGCMSAQTLKQIATIDLPGPSGQRFDYLTLQGHIGWVWKATFSPDRKLIATASEDQTARIWQALTLEDISRILVK